MTRRLSRRTFLQTSALAAAASTWPLSAKAVSANGKLRTAHIGVGGMGMSDLKSIMSHPMVEVAGLCDVDSERLGVAQKMHPNAKGFADFREMLDQMEESIDAVVVSTPDHTHAPAAMTALNLNKPVYCQKPLTHDIYESRQLRLAAEKIGVPTQMGIQIHSYPQYRQAKQLIRDGAIGKVSQVYAWCHKGWSYDGGPFTNVQSPPETLAWDLWLGTAAERPYVPEVYHPFQWRRLIDFGTGTLGDMGAHIFDTPFGALELTAPTTVKTTCKKVTGIGHAGSIQVEFEFPGTKYTTETLRCTWVDGDHVPLNSEALGLAKGTKLPVAGSLFVGEEGFLLLPHVDSPKLFPEEKFKDYQFPKQEPANHYHSWVDACLGKGQTTAGFSYGGPLTEMILLGVVGTHLPGQELQWDAENLTISNVPEANQYLKRTYREGFEVPGLS